MLGYTWNSAKDAYSLVNGDKNNFGDRRMKYIRGSYKNAPLGQFIQSSGMPDFIFEYSTPQKSHGIQLFYNKTDSVYVFEAPKKNCMCAAFKESRPIAGFEKQVYSELQKGNASLKINK